MAEQTLNKSRELIQLIPKDKLIFQQGPQKVTTNLTLSNSTSYKIAFKLKTTSPYDFNVCPSKGFIAPCSCLKVRIALLPNSDANKRRHKFLVLAKSVTSEDFAKIDWNDPNIEIHKLGVAFKDSCRDDINIELESVRTCRSETIYTEVDKNEVLESIEPWKELKKRKRKGKRKRGVKIWNLHVIVAFLLGILIGFFGKCLLIG